MKEMAFVLPAAALGIVAVSVGAAVLLTGTGIKLSAPIVKRNVKQLGTRVKGGGSALATK